MFTINELTKFIKSYSDSSKTKVYKTTPKLQQALYNHIKNETYSFSNYKWSIKASKSFIIKHSVKPAEYTLFLEDLFNTYHKTFNKRIGLRGAIKFVEQLNHSESFQNISIKKYSLVDSRNYLEFLDKMKYIKDNHLNISDKEWIDFIHDNFELNRSKAVIRKEYYIKTASE